MAKWKMPRRGQTFLAKGGLLTGTPCLFEFQSYLCWAALFGLVDSNSISIWESIWLDSQPCLKPTARDSWARHVASTRWPGMSANDSYASSKRISMMILDVFHCISWIPIRTTPVYYEMGHNLERFQYQINEHIFTIGGSQCELSPGFRSSYSKPEVANRHVATCH